MKTEEEIREFIKTIKTAEKSVPESNMVTMTDRAGHWLDCLEWVLDSEKRGEK